MDIMLFRILGALHLAHGFLLFGFLVHALDEKSGIELPREQWGIKTVLVLADISLLAIGGAAALLLEPTAFVFATSALAASILVAFSDTVTLRGPSALADIPAAFYFQASARAIAAFALFALQPSGAGA